MSFRAWGPKQNAVYARSITASTVTAVQPVGFANGGNQAKVYNASSTVAVLVCFYSHAAGDPTLTFPVDGTPPAGSKAGAARPDAAVTIVPPLAEKQISIPIGADSFAAIGAAAGPSLVYVQRGDGSV